MQKASDLLKGKEKQLWTILPEASVLDALKLMAEKEIGALIIMDKKNKVVGIITERDYARKIILKGKTSLKTSVKEIMTPNVVTIESDQYVLEACQRYKEFGVGCLVVMNNKLVVGILTERDIIERILVDEKNPKTTRVEDIMTKNIKTIHASARMEQAADVMKTYHIKKLPVIQNSEIVGIVTATDIANNMQNFSKEIKQIMTDETPFKFIEKTPYKKEEFEGY